MIIEIDFMNNDVQLLFQQIISINNKTRFYHLFQRLAISLMKGNASLIINRFQTFPTAQVDGDME